VTSALLLPQCIQVHAQSMPRSRASLRTGPRLIPRTTKRVIEAAQIHAAEHFI
jgi:hypothetical protein